MIAGLPVNLQPILHAGEIGNRGDSNTQIVDLGGQDRTLQHDVARAGGDPDRVRV
jgi:hypothetical protein